MDANGVPDESTSIVAVANPFHVARRQAAINCVPAFRLSFLVIEHTKRVPGQAKSDTRVRGSDS
jgi:hypothetical protein